MPYITKQNDPRSPRIVTKTPLLPIRPFGLRECRTTGSLSKVLAVTSPPATAKILMLHGQYLALSSQTSLTTTRPCRIRTLFPSQNPPPRNVPQRCLPSLPLSKRTSRLPRRSRALLPNRTTTPNSCRCNKRMRTRESKQQKRGDEPFHKRRGRSRCVGMGSRRFQTTGGDRRVGAISDLHVGIHARTWTFRGSNWVLVWCYAGCDLIFFIRGREERGGIYIP